MTRTTASSRIRIAAFVAIAFASACSIINTFEDTKPLTENGAYAPAVSDATIVVTTDGGVVTDGAPNPDAPLPANDAAAGAIVVGGQVANGDAGASSPTLVLSVLDPRTGHEIGPREKMVVASVRYDGARDIWYVFESKSPEWAPGPDAEVILHVRTLDLAMGLWTERASLKVPPLQNYESIGVLSERLIYVAHSSADAGAVQLVTIDTKDIAKPVIVDQQPLDRPPLGIVATRSLTGPGGTAGMVRMNTAASACTGAICTVELVRVRVPNGALPQIDAPTNMGQGPRNGIPAFATFTLAERDLVVFPRLAADASTNAALFEPRTQVAQGIATPFFVTDSNLRRAAVSDCTQTAFIVGTNSDLDLHAVPVLGDGGGVTGTIPTGHSGQAVYFEPTSRTVLAPFGQGAGFDLSAFHLGGTYDAPVLTRRTTDWDPPKDLRPILLAVRLVVPVACP